MKLRFLLVIGISFPLISMDQPSGQLLFALGQNSPRLPTTNLHDFITLKERTGKLCKIMPKVNSHDLEVKIMRIHSEGEVEPLDCESINRLIHIECAQAKNLLLSQAASNSVISHSLAQENYDQARARYQNALHHIIQAFALKCYRTMDTLHDVLHKFIKAEQAAAQAQPRRDLDQKTLELYPLLEKIVQKAESKEMARAPLIDADNTQDLIKKLEVPLRQSSDIVPQSKRSLENGNSHLKAGRELLQNLQDPSFESLENVERTFFIALEHFIIAYYRDTNQGIEAAQTALTEIEKVHNLKKNKFGKEGTRYNLAKEKIIQAKKNGESEKQEVNNRVPMAHMHEEHSNTTSDYERFLREDATQAKDHASDSSHAKISPPLLADPMPSSARSEDHTIQESERAVKENSEKDIVLVYIPPQRPQPQPASKITPLSLIKSAWNNGKKGSKYLWKKMPFN